jgi:hypothetical protein
MKYPYIPDFRSAALKSFKGHRLPMAALKQGVVQIFNRSE